MRLERLSRWLLDHLRDGSAGACILMYHGTPAAPPSNRYSLAAAEFRQQLDILAGLGWPSRCIRDLGNPLPDDRSSILLTFDDGYADNWSGAYLPLREYGMVATWFAVSARVGGAGDWEGMTATEALLLDAGALREMASQGMEIGSHSRRHGDLTTLAGSALDDEVSGSRDELEALLGQPVLSFAYPYGRYQPETLKAVVRAGYQHACSTRGGRHNPADDPYALRRITVYREDDPDHFVRKLWMGANQASRGDVLGSLFRRGLRRLRRLA